MQDFLTPSLRTFGKTFFIKFTKALVKKKNLKSSGRAELGEGFDQIDELTASLDEANDRGGWKPVQNRFN